MRRCCDRPHVCAQPSPFGPMSSALVWCELSANDGFQPQPANALFVQSQDMLVALRSKSDLALTGAVMVVTDAVQG